MADHAVRRFRPQTGLRLYAHRIGLLIRWCTWWGDRSWREVASIESFSPPAYCLTSLWRACAFMRESHEGRKRCCFSVGSAAFPGISKPALPTMRPVGKLLITL